MTANQDDIIRDQSERDMLLKAICDVETAVAYTTPGTQSLLRNFLENAKGRVMALDTKIKDEVVEREQRAQTEIALASLAQKESALGAREKETYSGFLAKEFFTKRDFRSLDQFYSNTWDRLSDDGKEELSHRFWEGIRHNEFRFTDAPAIVQDKEAKMAYRDLTGPSNASLSTLGQIPKADRADFIRAYQNGDSGEVGRILSRDSFRQNMAVESLTGIQHKTADLKGKAADEKRLVDNSKVGKPSFPKQDLVAVTPGSMADLPIESLNLNGVELVDASSATVAGIPDASGPRLNVR